MPVATALPVDVDLFAGSLVVQRSAAIERLVVEHHLDRVDAQLHVDGVLADGVVEVLEGARPALQAITAQLAEAFTRWSAALDAA